jgi:hypothetical protein
MIAKKAKLEAPGKGEEYVDKVDYIRNPGRTIC